MIPILFDLNKTTGTTLVLVTHDLDLAILTQRIIHLRRGKILDDPSKDTPALRSEGNR